MSDDKERMANNPCATQNLGYVFTILFDLNIVSISGRSVMETINQEKVLIQIDGSSLGSDIVLKSFSGWECLSSLFEYNLYFTSKSDSLVKDSVLKSKISVHIKTESHERFFH